MNNNSDTLGASYKPDDNNFNPNQRITLAMIVSLLIQSVLI